MNKGRIIMMSNTETKNYLEKNRKRAQRLKFADDKKRKTYNKNKAFYKNNFRRHFNECDDTLLDLEISTSLN